VTSTRAFRAAFSESVARSTSSRASTTIATFDFDAQKSVVVTGGGRVQVKPVIKIMVRKGGEPFKLAAPDQPRPTATPVPPTATPVPPTATPLPPTATPVPPTATPRSTATPTQTPTPTATPDPLGDEFFLYITSPQPEEEGDDLIIVTESSVVIEGRTRVDAAISVDDAFLDVNEEGRFEITLDLEEGPNVIEVVASIGTGEEEAILLIISYEPQ
jgi:hypothetical protein